MLAKMDIKQAYKNIPIYPNDRIYLEMQWNDSINVDTVLPFELRSAPLPFWQWQMVYHTYIIHRKGGTVIFYYLDDFIANC